jgi:hypothetical protein
MLLKKKKKKKKQLQRVQGVVKIFYKVCQGLVGTTYAK